MAVKSKCYCDNATAFILQKNSGDRGDSWSFLSVFNENGFKITVEHSFE